MERLYPGPLPRHRHRVKQGSRSRRPSHRYVLLAGVHEGNRPTRSSVLCRAGHLRSSRITSNFAGNEPCNFPAYPHTFPSPFHKKPATSNHNFPHPRPPVLLLIGGTNQIPQQTNDLHFPQPKLFHVEQFKPPPGNIPQITRIKPSSYRVLFCLSAVLSYASAEVAA